MKWLIYLFVFIWTILIRLRFGINVQYNTFTGIPISNIDSLVRPLLAYLPYILSVLFYTNGLNTSELKTYEYIKIIKVRDRFIWVKHIYFKNMMIAIEYSLVLLVSYIIVFTPYLDVHFIFDFTMFTLSIYAIIMLQQILELHFSSETSLLIIIIYAIINIVITVELIFNEVNLFLASNSLATSLSSNFRENIFIQEQMIFFLLLIKITILCIIMNYLFKRKDII